MSVHYNETITADLTRIDLEHKIAVTRATLKKLQSFDQVFSGSASGDAEFDVEPTAAVNIARAALLRLQAMLGEQSGTLEIDLGHEEEFAIPAYRIEL